MEISAKGVIPLEWRWMHLPRRSSCGDVDGSSEKVIPVERGKYLRRGSALGRMSKYPRRGPSLRCKGECIPEGGHPLKEVSLKGASLNYSRISRQHVWTNRRSRKSRKVMRKVYNVSFLFIDTRNIQQIVHAPLLRGDTYQTWVLIRFSDLQYGR